MVTGSDKFNHVTDRLVDVALTLSTFRAQCHVAPSDAGRVAVQQVPGTLRVIGVNLGGGEVDNGDVEMLAGFSVDDPRPSRRAAK